MAVGDRIRRARQRRRMTQRDLAETLGVDRKTVDNWENGRTSPRNAIGALEDVLGPIMDDPAKGAPSGPVEPELEAAPDERLSYDEAVRAIWNLPYLSKARRRALIELLDEPPGEPEQHVG